MSPADRFDWFCATVSSDVMPFSLSTDRAADFHATMTDLDLGTVRMSAFAFSPMSARRSAAHIRQGDPESYQLNFVSAGTLWVNQLGRDALVTGDIVLSNTSRPSETACLRVAGPVRTLTLQIPRSALPLRPNRVDRLLAQRIPARHGTGAILAGFLGTLLDQRQHCGDEELSRMGAVTLDLVTACLAQQLGDPEERPAEACAQTMLHRVHGFIEHNLGDPDLTPQAIASRHHISLRTLYALFQGRPESVAGFIRRRRLERCHADLARPASREPVQAIAARWGFASATAFTRSFRDAYGTTPTEHRENARRARQAETGH
ncbi:helix-turn-helix domain-containing protein [Kitasatospora sp. NBC_00240]|uniref:AraC-like ligand-binding domain-containing protein n=1 Tax=Kitasatospora sp. NBC_00240 TaxID=2903567 RepID=UPI00225493C6|nr:helix-turn-helix domain-containing protein [Kitasatospora sp. NBC_00240]MCX5214642.1 helix-turn-helix domain-containing protein [Kitasatospora sp. NBC_00240]